jgi:hypothetical protein
MKPARLVAMLALLALLAGERPVEIAGETWRDSESDPLPASGATQERFAQARSHGRRPPTKLEASETNPGSAAARVTAGPNAIEAFDSWTQRFVATPAALRQPMIAEGLRLARARRPMFLSLIQTDPQRALKQTMPRAWRQQLPAIISAELERPIAQRASMAVLAASPDSRQNGHAPYLRLVNTRGGETFEAHVFGRRELQFNPLEDFHAIGVAMNSHLALDENPGRRIEVGERPPRDKPWVEFCPVSGKSTQLQATAAQSAVAQSPAVETGDQVLFLCDGAHVQPYLNGLILAEAGSGGAQSFNAAMLPGALPALGAIKVLYVPAIFSDQEQVPASEFTCLKMLREVADFYQTQSYGKLSLIATVAPPVRLPRTQAWYSSRDGVNSFDGLSAEMTHAKDAAAAMGYDWRDFHCFCVRSSGGARWPTSFASVGNGSIGRGQVWMRSDSSSTLAHEIGHSFGLLHANFWQTNGSSVIGPGSNTEYGDPFDNMGSSTPPNGHYNVQAKHQVGWLTEQAAPMITRSGRYRIAAFDSGRLEPGLRYALRLRKDDDRTYWGGLRRAFSTNDWTQHGLLLGWKWPKQSGGGNWQLLDTTPGSSLGRDDAALGRGGSFSDPESGIHITNLGLISGSNPPALELQVNLLQADTNNRPPTLSLTPSQAAVPLNAPITFTASASDPDGDELTYSWRWQDNVASPNSPVVTRSFSTAGLYGVVVVASDMKGGQSLRQALVTVGNGNSRFLIRGRVTDLSGAPMRGVALTTTQGGNAVGSLSDDEGFYTLTNLAAGTYNLSAQLQGHGFIEAFNNSVTVGPNFSGADFVASAQPEVRMSLQPGTLIEGGGEGLLLLERSGDLDAPLVINLLNPSGDAGVGTDFNLSPPLGTSSDGVYRTATIAAGQTSLGIRLTLINDVSAEPQERARFTLAGGPDYRVAGLASSTLLIQDNDGNLPTVSLMVGDEQVNEGESMPIELRRSGSTNSTLEVDWLLDPTSSAQAGVDFEALPQRPRFEIGESTLLIPLNLPQDAVSRGIKTLRLSLQNTAACWADPSNREVLLRLLDDDASSVSLEVVDGLATEVDSSQPGAVADPGCLLLTRSGDLSQDLRVYFSCAGSALHGNDYRALGGSLDFAPGQAQLPLMIEPIADRFAEGDEMVTVMLAEGGGTYRCASKSSASITLRDAPGDKPLLELMTASAAATENGSNGSFRITARGLRSAVSVNYTISGSATAGSDYGISGLNTATRRGSITLTPSTSTDLVTPLLVDCTSAGFNDNQLEELESIVMTLDPSSDYVISPRVTSATLLLRDDDQPTVFVDAHVGSGNRASISESDTSTPCRFWISRAAATSQPLVVGFTVGGSATAGRDYTEIGNSVTIPAYSLGAEVSFVVESDALAEGTETVVLQLAANGSSPYARGPAASIQILDDETLSPHMVAFAGQGVSVAENSGVIQVPVTLNQPATSPVTVDYAVDGGPRTPTSLFGTWLRIIRSGQNFSAWYSHDGENYFQIGATQSLPNIATTSLVAGLVLNSGRSSATARARVDQLRIDGLDASSIGVEALTRWTTPSSASGSTRNGDEYQLVGNGADPAADPLRDNGILLGFALSNAPSFTLTARILGLESTTPDECLAGLTLRSSTASTGPQFSALAGLSSGCRRYLQTHRSSNSATLVNSLESALIYPKGTWLRLQRSGGQVQIFSSPNGSTWVAAGSALDLPFNSRALVGLAASSAADGQLCTAVFDQVSLVGAAGALQSRSLGSVSQAGDASGSDQRWVLRASGAGILPSASSTEDAGHLAVSHADGDFTLTARLASLTGGASNAQAGLILRDSSEAGSRTLWWGLSGSGSSGAQWLARLSSSTNASGAGIDFQLSSGQLTFAVGEQRKTIAVNLVDDLIPEATENLHLLLRNPTNAVLGLPSHFAVSIGDDDSIRSTPPLAQWVEATSSRQEGSDAVIQVALSAASTQTVVIPYRIQSADSSASATADYILADGTLTLQAGETLGTLRFPIVDDELIEATETLMLQLGTPTNAALASLSNHRLSLIDNDTPAIEVRALTTRIAESGASLSVEFSRSGSLASPLSVNFSTAGTASAGSDFVAPTGSISFAAQSATTSLQIALLNDNSVENDETLSVVLAAAAGYTLGGSRQVDLILEDDDSCTVSLSASDGVAAENGLDSGSWLLTRSGPLTGSLSVNLQLTGNAVAGSDYTSPGLTAIIPAGQGSLSIALNPLQDNLSEGEEWVVLSLAAGSYRLGQSTHAAVLIRDDDLAPTVFIRSPVAASAILSSGNGLRAEATASDDGLPQPLTYAWSQLFGPGTCSFSNPNAAQCDLRFDLPGTYAVRVEVSDGQMKATDELTIQYGGLQPIPWIAVNQGPGTSGGLSGENADGSHLLLATGRGYSGSNDSGHFRYRSLGMAGSASLRLRLVSLGGASTRSAGIALRQSSWQGARGTALLVDANGLVQCVVRDNPGANSSVAASLSGRSLPLWMELQYNAGTVTARVAPDVAGNPGTWAAVGSSRSQSLGNTPLGGMLASSGSSSNETAARFDRVPSFTEAALLSEDLGASPGIGSSSESLGTLSVTGIGTQDASGGHFRYRQIWGDCIITARLNAHDSASAGSRGAQTGIAVRESGDQGAFGFFGITTLDGFQAQWRSAVGASISSVTSSGSLGDWLRIIRRGSQLRVLRAINQGGQPGPWTQVGSPLPAALPGAILVGVLVDSNSSTASVTGSLQALSIEPYNLAPQVAIASISGNSPVILSGSVTDDGRPEGLNPSLRWSQFSGPGSLSFVAADQAQTTANATSEGAYQVRFSAWDGDAESFVLGAFSAFPSPFARWLISASGQITGSLQQAATADPDGDGLPNLLEYLLGSQPAQNDAPLLQPQIFQRDGKRYLSLRVPLNSQATGLSYRVEGTGTPQISGSWSTQGIEILPLSPAVFEARDAVPLDEAPMRYLRLRAELQP